MIQINSYQDDDDDADADEDYVDYDDNSIQKKL